jgi:hypothetical protein
MKFIFAIAISICFSAHAHQGHHHGNESQVAKREGARPSIQPAYKQIESDYDKEIKPIFEMKCAACHSSSVKAPWYAKIPIAGGIVESDRTEAKEHLEISKGFPFAGHGTPLEDLEAIQSSVTKNSMPTNLYRFMHPSSELTNDEKTKILAWTANGKNLISKFGTTENTP